MSQTVRATNDDVSVAWQQLSERIDAFVAAWQKGGEPPAPADFVPTEPPALRRLTLVELIKVDLEYRWQGRRSPKLIEEYLAEFPELADSGELPCDLIYEEYHVRNQHGDEVTIDEYCQRFPTRADELRRLFQLDAPSSRLCWFQPSPCPRSRPGSKSTISICSSPLGKGAFATVFLARQRSMQRLVALKISRDRGFEPQTLAQLDHPHIVRVFDQRQLPDHKLRLLYMQYVAGGTLQGVVDARCADCRRPRAAARP